MFKRVFRNNLKFKKPLINNGIFRQQLCNYNKNFKNNHYYKYSPIALGGMFWIFSPNYDNVKQEIRDLLDDYEWDDGSWGPVLVRLAWHASGTYDKGDNSGGTCKTGMYFKDGIEASDPANAGLQHARKKMESVKEKHPELSYADLWVLASYVAIEEMGGPSIEFQSGRKDLSDASLCPPNGRLPDASQGAKHVRDVFYRMGFNDQEIVALLGGGHAIGRCHKDRSGYNGPWTRAPTTISNEFYRVLLDETWEFDRWKEPKQFHDASSKDLMMLPTDLSLRTDPEFRKHVQIYYDDEEKFKKDFGAAFKKLTELGL